MNRDMETTIAGVRLKNPVTTASGTFGSGREYGDLIDLNHLGAITVKGVSDGGFTTIVFPQTKAFPIFLAASASGKFQATIPTVTP